MYLQAWARRHVQNYSCARQWWGKSPFVLADCSFLGSFSSNPTPVSVSTFVPGLCLGEPKREKRRFEDKLQMRAQACCFNSGFYFESL